MTRTGLFRYVTWERLDAYLAQGWLPVADLGPRHGQWAVLCWHCGCCAQGAPPPLDEMGAFTA
jgi:hypothetical protein